MAATAVQIERARRDAMWEDLCSRGDPNSATPRLIADVGVRAWRTGQGVYRDQEHSEPVAPPHGVTLTLLDTGRVYADHFDEDGGIYHYPGTLRSELRDASEIEATKNAARLGLPVFVVFRAEDRGRRRVRRAWIADWNDNTQTFLIAFEDSHAAPPSPAHTQDDQFLLQVSGARRLAARLTATRPGQARFAFSVFKRCGSHCVFCNLGLPPLLEAAHVCPVSEGGSDDPRNGLVACRNHHRAFDLQLIGVDPHDLTVVAGGRGLSLTALGVSTHSLKSLAATPHPEALKWRWERFTRRIPLVDE